MFSALKKWAKGGNEDSKLSTPMGVRAMGQALQRKFARGVQYNSKFFFHCSKIHPFCHFYTIHPAMCMLLTN